MINTEERIELLGKLQEYMLSDDAEWEEMIERANYGNGWFIRPFVENAAHAIAKQYLTPSKLREWLLPYQIPEQKKQIGIVMAGNIPMVGFHDVLCGFVCGHQLKLKLSTKDAVLIPHLIRKLGEWQPEILNQIHFSEMLKHCDAYIATGSNNTSRYFEQYFGKYPNIIRKNRTSVAVMDGTETEEEFELLSKDLFQYYGLGCRNVTQICVPEGYDFSPLLAATAGMKSLMDNHKYANNYDYYLAIYLLNQVPYLTNDMMLLVENDMPFSPVAVLHYRYYKDAAQLASELSASEDLQCIVGHGHQPFGSAQHPSLSHYADGIDTMAFLCSL